jgi:hypothetical protein
MSLKRTDFSSGDIAVAIVNYNTPRAARGA